MESYEKEWLASRPVEHAIMHTIGLFDRPASGDCLHALRKKPAIKGLTDALVDLDEDQWRRAIARLRRARLLSPLDPSAPDAIDAHPLVREYFGARLEQTDRSAWAAAHGRIYEHLRDTTKEGQTPTLVDLAPLYQAIAHGCRSGRYQEALEEVYVSRICRREGGETVFYSAKKFSALGSDLAAMFFDRPYETPVKTLRKEFRSWVIATSASFVCRRRQHASFSARGHFRSAFGAFRPIPPALSTAGSRNLDPLATSTNIRLRLSRKSLSVTWLRRLLRTPSAHHAMKLG
jgi:hypothetical protein